MGRKIEGLIGRMQRSQTLTETVGEILVSSTRARFGKQAGPDGEKWDTSLRAEAEGGVTLTDNAVLKNSIGYEATRKMVAVGTNVVYGAIHQLGGMAGRGKKVELPARPYLGLDDDDRAEVQATIEEFMGV
jgi:phage virion morphogenesis protein